MSMDLFLFFFSFKDFVFLNGAHFGPHMSLIQESCYGPQPGRRSFLGGRPLADIQQVRGVDGTCVLVRLWRASEWALVLPGVNLSLQVILTEASPSSLQMEGPVSCAKVPEHVQSPVVHEENDVPAIKVVMPYSPWPQILPPSPSSVE